MKPDHRVYDSELWELEQKIVTNGVLAAAEIGVLRRCLGSSSDGDRILAAQGLLRHNYSEQLTRAAIDVVGELCEASLAQTHHFDPNLIMLLLFLPQTLLHSRALFRSFVLAAASAADPSARVNAVILLAKLAAKGDAEAREKLHAAQGDPDALVRQNAFSLSKTTRKDPE